MQAIDRLVHLFLAATFVACVIIGAAPTARAAGDEHVIRDLEARWVKAVAAKDVAWIANLYAPDGRLMPPNAKAAVGRDAVRAAWTAMLGTPGFALTFAPAEVRVAKAGDMASDIGTWEQPGPDGKVGDQGKYVVVWKKLHGEWKVLADIFNSDRPSP
jgi:uncharacterized protein (TIGR02246 family)